MSRFFTRFGTLIFFTCCATTFALAEDWPGWRGPATDGHSKDTALPVKWNAKSVVWKTALPGVGQSSPVISGDRIFLTAALNKGEKRVVLCVDRKNGKILWQEEAWSGVPEKTHVMNGWASATCATDGERVIAFFGKGGLHCYSTDGKKIWSRNLGPFEGPWGTSACPLIAGDIVYQNCDATAKAFVIAVDKKTGKDIWKTPRPDTPKGGWSSPVLADAGQHKELVINGETHVISYDPLTGKELWKCKAFNGRGEPTVAPVKDRVCVVNGLTGDIYSIKLGGSGDVTKSHMAWHTPRKGGRDGPSPIIVGNYLVVCDMTGITTCYESASGSVLWKDRLRGAFTASPIAAKGLVYFINEAGETSVLEPGPTFKLVGENQLDGKAGDLFRASPAASNGQIFLRSHSHLYCIGNGM